MRGAYSGTRKYVQSAAVVTRFAFEILRANLRIVLLDVNVCVCQYKLQGVETKIFRPFLLVLFSCPFM